MLADRVVPEPEYLQVGEGDEVLELPQVADEIFAQIELFQFLGVLENFERSDVKILVPRSTKRNKKMLEGKQK